MNTTADTPFGRGLGLETAGSIFLYSRNPRCDPQSSLLDGPDRELLIEAYRRGWVDTLHSLGDFSNVGGCTRALAERAFEELEKIGMRFRVWVNHGDHFNRQNFGTGIGDDPASSCYISDLALRHGIRFVWFSRLTHVIGQDRPCGRREFYLEAPHSFWRRSGALLADFARDFAGERAVRKLGVEPYEGNEQIRPRVLRDGNKVYDFIRYGFWRFDTIRDLPILLRESILERLIASGGSMIIYLHFGESRGETSEELRAGLQTLRDVAERERRGEIWIRKTGDLLEYTALRNALRVRLVRENGRQTFEISGLDDPLRGFRSPTPEVLSHLTFWFDPPGEAGVHLTGHGPLPVETHPPDLTGRPSITIL